ncbi:hypothetical protein MIND_00128400 [Mycena indigotica]|uniref:DUF6534 domain-containing protein n=1 Tax=Mycena indigotica TaxID=2126181 RepID=A0A8H6TEA1_9AGAR|nr:uncharacterized protein MIND_00128400 [Mycena indigotica]KAF7316103.1 hypothetical protein MIND_00128400 [Mycena indigotica]
MQVKGTRILYSTMSQPQVSALITYALGGWDLSVAGDLLLQGVIFAQTAHYFTLYHSDLLALRLFVAGLLLFTTLKSMQMIAILWTQNVTHFTDVRGATMLFATNWLGQINLGFGASISFYIQIFMCQRLWSLSKNIYVVIVLVTMFTFSLAAAWAVVILTFNNRLSSATWISVHFGVVLGGDLLLCGSMAFFLLKHSKHVLPQTAGMLNAILKLTIQSAMPGAICAMITVIASQTGDRSVLAKPSTTISIIASNVLPKLYALSAMWTLNSRRTILLSRSTGQNTSSEGPSGGRRTGASGARALELGDLGKGQHIQVRTHVQTTHHTDDEANRTHAERKAQEMDDIEASSTENSLRQFR